MRGLTRALVVAGALSAPACSAPEDALTWSCRTSVLSVLTECDLGAKVLNQARSAYPDGNTKNFKVRVSATFSVETGRVEVAIPACSAGGLGEAAPGRPATIACDVTLSRSTFRYTVEARPLDGRATGFAGRLTSRPI